MKKKSFSVHDLQRIQPLNYPQQEFFEHYPNFDVISLTGAAGSGKTLIALFQAFRDVVNEHYKSIKLVRSAVPTREIGYLPGNQKEKESVYETPYINLCDFIFKYKSNNYRNLKDCGVVDFVTTSYLRGETWDDCIVIVDECENCTLHELDSVITRLGKRSKIIFCGDTSQTDLIVRKNDVSGWPEFERILQRMSEYVNIHFTKHDVIRGGIVKSYLIAKEET